MPKIKLGLRLLETLTTALYDDPIILFREYVQNSVDAYIRVKESKKFKGFKTSIEIDEEHSNIFITDNGFGIPEDEFIEKMTTIGSSEKSQYTDQIGFRGIGRLSGIPFCQKLIFTNKVQGLDRCLVFTWDGEKFRKYLNEGKDIALDEAIEKLTTYERTKYKDSKKDHFFKVEIHGYRGEIVNLLKDKQFKNNLQMLLPLKYDPMFKSQGIIIDHYKKYMCESIEKFAFDVYLDAQPLYKPYSNKNILESEIVFWDLQYPNKRKGLENEKVGILWFTFNKVITANPRTEPFGILVRSKNMLMGNGFTLAEVVTRSKTQYVATYRELAQALQGVYGELLINTPRLNDNARRDWFKIDDASIILTNIIVEFMRRLHEYRYAASHFFSGKTREKDKLVACYKNLTSVDSAKFLSEVNQFKPVKENFEFADDDIPDAPQYMKKFYALILKYLRDYYKKEKNLEEFFKIRAELKKRLNAEPNR